MQPGQQPEQWVEECSSQGWADQRMSSQETEFQGSAEGWRRAARNPCGNSGSKSEVEKKVDIKYEDDNDNDDDVFTCMAT